MAYFGYNKKKEKLAIFDQNPGLTPFENVPTFYNIRKHMDQPRGRGFLGYRPWSTELPSN